MPKTPPCLNAPRPPYQGCRRRPEYLAMQANRNQVAGMGACLDDAFLFGILVGWGRSRVVLWMAFPIISLSGWLWCA